MRNLRRALSLALASVMILGLMIVGSNAMTADFGDADQIDEQYSEAIDVLTTVGLIDGMDDDANSFNPLGTLTRAQAAKLLSVMLLGEDNAAKLGTNTQIFQDVPKGNWAAGYIAYCNSVGILAGNGDGTFNPEGKLTGVQFGKMLLVALGYRADIESYVNDPAWETNVATDMLEAGIDVEDITFSEPITREQAAQMVFNTIIAPMVRYTSNNNVTTLEYVTTTLATEQTISTEYLSNTNLNYNNPPVYTVEFGEKNLKNLNRDYIPDDFGRPSYLWKWKNTEIGTYIDSDKLIAEYSNSITGKTLYELLGNETIRNYTFNISIDGVEVHDGILSDYLFDEYNLVRTNTEIIGGTGRGVLTQVFLDPSYRNETVYISIINTYLAKTNNDYNSKKNIITLDVYNADHVSGEYVKDYSDKTTIDVSGDDFAIKDLKSGEFFLVTIANEKVQTMVKPEVLSDISLVGFKYKDYVNTSDARYDYADTEQYDTNVLKEYDHPNFKEVTYDLILDIYGNIIGIEENKGDPQYVFITGSDKGNSNLSSKSADMNAIFIDGTTKVITVESIFKNGTGQKEPLPNSPLINKWYKYTVDKNDVYTLTTIDVASTTNPGSKLAQYKQDIADEPSTVATDPFKINDRNNVALRSWNSGTSEGYVYGNDKSVYITVSGKIIENPSKYYVIDDVDSTVVGSKNANIEVYDIIDDEPTVAASSKKHSVHELDSEHTGSSCVNLDRNEIFTLYEDGYIIATVILGENGGSTSSYAYVTSASNQNGVKYEGWSQENEEWSWTREVVINGKQTTIREVGSQLNKLDKMIQGEWYEVQTDEDGNVRKVTPVPFGATGKYVTDPDEVNVSIIDKDLVMLHAKESATPDLVDGITYKNGTLYTDKMTTAGYHVSPNVKVVLINAKYDKNGNLIKFSDIEEYEGLNGLEGALKAIDSVDSSNISSDKFIGDLSVILENGYATVIILNDTFGHYIDQGSVVTPTTPTSHITSVKLDDTDLADDLLNVTTSGAEATQSYSYTLYMRGPNQDEFKEAAVNGATINNNQFTIAIPENLKNSYGTYTFYVVIKHEDGFEIESDPNTFVYSAPTPVTP